MTVDVRGIGMTSQRTRDRLVERLREKGILDERVLTVLAEMPRHLFVDEALASRAYEDSALPIGFNQTISQPYVVARMTAALIEAGIPSRVLEVGTGSGYQTAILAKLVARVFSVERIEGLWRMAESRFRQLDLYNIRSKLSDGNWGWKENAPYDAILVTAAPAELPGEFLQQLSEGGRLVIPVGHEGQQNLLRITRCGNEFKQELLDLVSFVPLLKGTVK